MRRRSLLKRLALALPVVPAAAVESKAQEDDEAEQDKVILPPTDARSGLTAPEDAGPDIQQLPVRREDLDFEDDEDTPEPATSNGGGRTAPEDEEDRGLMRTLDLSKYDPEEIERLVETGEPPDGCFDNPLVEGNRCTDDEDETQEQFVEIEIPKLEVDGPAPRENRERSLAAWGAPVDNRDDEDDE